VDTDTPPLSANDDQECERHFHKFSADTMCRLLPGSGILRKKRH